MAERVAECLLPACGNEASPDLTDRVCPFHARRIYTDVRRMVENATTAQRVEALRGTGGKAKPPRNMQPGYVYFFLAGELVKIGWSADPKTRLRQVRAERILGYFPGTPQDEKAMHARFGHLWERGEYFRADPSLIEFAESLGVPA